MNQEFLDRYFNNSHNFTNQVPNNANNVHSSVPDGRQALQNFDCGNNIMLEPRLQEYLKKLKYYRTNKIIPSVPLEQEFQINDLDKKRVMDFFKGQTDLYNDKKYQMIQKNQRQEFPSKEFRDDPRVPKLNTKRPNDVKNLGMFMPNNSNSHQNYYEGETVPVNHPLDSRDIINNSEFIDEYYPENDSSAVDDFIIGSNNQPDNKYMNIGGDTRNNQMLPNMAGSNDMAPAYPKRSSLQWNPYLEYNYNQAEQIGQQHNNLSPVHDMNESSYMDVKEKRVIPNMKSRRDRPNTTSYQPIPYQGHGAGQGDPDIETCIQFGMPTRTFKSYGYRNPAEHYYDYIEEDMQQPNNVVLPFPRGGVSTRLDNKRRTYNRTVM